jgi:hypothetical protein
VSKAGKKMLAGVREALAVAQGDFATISRIKVTPSCGCVFCDVGLPPDADGVHRADNHPDVKCRSDLQ